ncbi:MAG: transcriptional repressor [Anaerolineae bacterium]|nr:transcriptional repressor [Anaerolineae bacterium]
MRTSSVEQLILDLFAGQPVETAHFTAQEIYLQLKPQLPAVNPSTIYRALERMTRSGKISISDMGKGAAVFEIVGKERHHHLVCETCHQVITLSDDTIRPLFDELSRQFGFEMTTNHLVLFGHCPACRRKK